MWMFGGGGGYGSNEAGLMLLYPQSLQLFFPRAKPKCCGPFSGYFHHIHLQDESVWVWRGTSELLVHVTTDGSEIIAITLMTWLLGFPPLFRIDLLLAIKTWADHHRMEWPELLIWGGDEARWGMNSCVFHISEFVFLSILRFIKSDCITEQPTCSKSDCYSQRWKKCLNPTFNKLP